MNNKSLGYLGLDFQYKLVRYLIEDKTFFRDIYEIINNNMFTDVNLKRVVGILIDFYKSYEYMPSYDLIEIELRNKSKDDKDIEIIKETLDSIKNFSYEGVDSIKEIAFKFFKQQNLIKVVNKINDIIKLGNVDRYDECEVLIRESLMKANKEEIGIRLRDNLGDVLSEDYRKVIPTGIEAIDKTLEGGLGKGEFGMIIAPSGFGKTTITTAIANHAALHGHKVVQIVFEDKEKQIQRKHISKITNIEAKDLSKPQNYDNVKYIMDNMSAYDENLIIKKFPTGEKTVPQIKNYLSKLKNLDFNPDLVIIDYFECLAFSKNFRDQWTGEAQTARELESMASDLDIALWVPTQGTKDSLNVEIVTLDKAGGSFKKMQIAHIVISIARSIDELDNYLATIAVLKNRSGKAGTVLKDIYFNNGTCTIDTSGAVEYDDIRKYKQEDEQEIVKDLLDKKKKQLLMEENTK